MLKYLTNSYKYKCLDALRYRGQYKTNRYIMEFETATSRHASSELPARLLRIRIHSIFVRVRERAIKHYRIAEEMRKASSRKDPSTKRRGFRTGSRGNPNLDVSFFRLLHMFLLEQQYYNI